MSKLYIMMGLPGSGKSTFLKNYIKPLDNSVIVSRDEIRFSLLKDGENYFAHEEEVKNILWDTINEELSKGNNVYVDQTSLNKKSRALLLNHINLNNCEKISIIWCDTALDCCLENNETRKDTKAYVPRGVIRRMMAQLEPPCFNEGFDCIYIYAAYPDKIYKMEEGDWYGK